MVNEHRITCAESVHYRRFLRCLRSSPWRAGCGSEDTQAWGVSAQPGTTLPSLFFCPFRASGQGGSPSTSISHTPLWEKKTINHCLCRLCTFFKWQVFFAHWNSLSDYQRDAHDAKPQNSRRQPRRESPVWPHPRHIAFTAQGHFVLSVASLL